MADENEQLEERTMTEIFNYPVYEWSPKEDITTYELAQCTPLLIGFSKRGSHVSIWENAINDLSESCQRHFKIVGDQS